MLYTGKVARRTRFNIVCINSGSNWRRMIIFPIKGLKLFTAVRITRGLPPPFVLQPFFNKKYTQILGTGWRTSLGGQHRRWDRDANDSHQIENNKNKHDHAAEGARRKRKSPFLSHSFVCTKVSWRVCAYLFIPNATRRRLKSFWHLYQKNTQRQRHKFNEIRRYLRAFSDTPSVLLFLSMADVWAAFCFFFCPWCMCISLPPPAALSLCRNAYLATRLFFPMICVCSFPNAIFLPALPGLSKIYYAGPGNIDNRSFGPILWALPLSRGKIHQRQQNCVTSQLIVA